MKGLIAHSSESLRQEAWRALDRLGWEVIEADDARDAERVCRFDPPDVALIEGALAWPEGGSLLAHFKRDPQLRMVPVVVLERSLDFDKALAGLDAGAHGYLVEPVTEPEVAVTVRAADRVRTLEARLADQHEELSHLVHTDPLTRLFGRGYLARQVIAQINAARRHGHALAVLLVDIDQFKLVNDSFGHAAGDRALERVARVLETRLRDIDIPGRWGGDEFLVLLPMTQLADAMRVGRDLCAAVRGADGLPAPITLSVGCAAWEGDDPSELVDRADRALYEVKRSGRDGVAKSPPRAEYIRVATPEAADGRERRLRVVLVDDVESIRSLLSLTLEGDRIEVVGQAADGAEACTVATETRPDVVIMDWNMPGTDGLVGTRSVLREVPGVRVVAFTSSDDPRVHRALRDAGAVAHFNKSHINDLIAYLHNLHGELAGVPS